MLSFDSTQESILASDYKLLYWLFEIDSTYYWSTKYVPNTVYNSQIYTFKVLPDSFKRIRLAAPDRESGSISTLADTYFEISNKDNTYASSDFKNSSVIIKLVMSDGTNTELMAQWGFNVMSCVDLDQRLGFNCEDFLQPFLEGDYPKTKLVSSIRPAIGDPDDDLCLPVIFGTAYIPIRSQWIPSERYYMLGTTADAFTVSEIRSPREFGRSIFESGSFTFTYTDKTVGNTTYRTMRPAIAETDTPGVYATGVWTSGEKMMDPFFKITRTGSSTDPATVIRLVLQDMGVPAAKIDAAGSFAAATAVYTGWGLDFNGAFYKKDSCRAVLARLLIMCNSTLRVTDKIELHPLELNNSDSVATHTGAEILKESFSYNNIIQEASVAASVAFQLASEPVDELVPITIPVKEDSSGAILDNISEDLLDIRWVQDSQDVQRIGILHFQRKYLGEANPSYKTKMSELGVQPEDIVTVTGSRYGGPHYILVNELSINKDASIDIGGIAYSDELDNWSDLSPDVVDIEQEYIIFSETWTPIFSGPGSTPDSGTGANVLPGEIIVGDYSTVNYIVINPIGTQILLNDDGTDRVVIGHLGGGDYGIAIVDPDGNTVVRIDSSQATFAGWTIAPTRLYSITSSHGIVLDSDEMFLSIYNETFATLGIQAQYNVGNPRFYVGDGGSNYLRFEDGNLDCSGITINGSDIDGGEFSGGGPDFIFTITGSSFRLPLYNDGIYDFNVDWGDLSSTDITEWDDSNKTHYYAGSGTYTITISGKIYKFGFNSSEQRDKIINISNWGSLEPGDLPYEAYGGHFAQCSNLTSVTATDTPNLSTTTTIEGMFQVCYSLTAVSGLENWDLSGITNINNIFYGDTALTSINVRNWNTSNVTTMRRIFMQCTNLTALDVADWDTSSCQDMDEVFVNCNTVNMNVSNWDTSSCKDMTSMFLNCQLFNRSLASWDVSNVESMSRMFDGCTIFNQNLNGWNVSSVTNMCNMFAEAENFNQPLDNWNVSSVTNMSNMFEKAYDFNQPLNNWTTSSCTTMMHMFLQAYSFDQNLNSWNTSNVTYMQGMFQIATSFNRNLAAWDFTNVQGASFSLRDAFDASGFSDTNYSNLLVSLDSQSVHEWQMLGADACKYYAWAASARAGLIAKHWEIDDDGPV